jgi:hypothetical protein
VNRRIDPAALLIAVLTVGVDPLTINGPWEKINTIVAAVVGVILAAYTWPRRIGAEPEASVAPTDNWILAAQAIAYGLIIAIAAGWPVQEAMRPPDCPDHAATVLPAGCIRLEQVADDATWWALGVGGLAALILFFLLRRTHARLAAGPGSTTATAPPPRR